MKQSIRGLALILGIGLLMTSPGVSQGSGKFRSDDPLRLDPDQLAIPQPQPVDPSQVFDFLENTFGRRPDKNTEIPPPENVNTLGEVPDSSWFTNRMSRQALTPFWSSSIYSLDPLGYECPRDSAVHAPAMPEKQPG